MTDDTTKKDTEELTGEEEKEREEIIEKLDRLDELHNNLEQGYMKLHTHLKPLNQTITDMHKDLHERDGDESWGNVRDHYFAYHSMFGLIAGRLSEAEQEIDKTREEIGFELVKVKKLLGIEYL